jgi:hypothetical protein
MQAERNGDLAGDHAADADSNRIWRDVTPAGRKEILVLLLAHVDAAAAAADEHTGIRLSDTKAASRHASRPAITPNSAARE